MSSIVLHNLLLITEQRNCHSEKPDAFISSIMDTDVYKKNVRERISRNLKQE